MIDATTKERICVETYPDSAPLLTVPLAQLEEVKALLDTNKISYWVDEEVLSIDGKPEIAFVNLGRQTDPVLTQQLLDSVP